MIQLRNISHHFTIGKKGSERIIPVLHDISLQIGKGEIVTLLGRSGSGKSTLLNLISGYIHPVEGEIIVAGTDVTRYSEGRWADFRLKHFGFIFQSFQLIPSMTAAENVALPLVLRGIEERQRNTIVMSILERVGLSEFGGHYPSELSGGQQQRVSIARALVLNPPMILADEPTGSLDSENEQSLLDFIRELNRDQGITFMIITHDEQVASIGHRALQLQNGRLAGTGTGSDFAAPTLIGGRYEI